MIATIENPENARQGRKQGFAGFLLYPSENEREFKINHI